MLQTAVAVLCTVVSVLFTYQVKEHRECKRDRIKLRELYEDALKDIASLKGQFSVYKSVFRKLNISLPQAIEEAETEDG